MIGTNTVDLVRGDRLAVDRQPPDYLGRADLDIAIDRVGSREGASWVRLSA